MDERVGVDALHGAGERKRGCEFFRRKLRRRRGKEWGGAVCRRRKGCSAWPCGWWRVGRWRRGGSDRARDQLPRGGCANILSTPSQRNVESSFAHGNGKARILRGAAGFLFAGLRASTRAKTKGTGEARSFMMTTKRQTWLGIALLCVALGGASGAEKKKAATRRRWRRRREAVQLAQQGDAAGAILAFTKRDRGQPEGCAALQRSGRSLPHDAEIHGSGGGFHEGDRTRAQGLRGLLVARRGVGGAESTRCGHGGLEQGAGVEAG